MELNGRFLMAEFSDRGVFYRVACIYAPNRNPEQDSFFASSADLVDLVVPTVLCGNFNGVFNRTLDRKGAFTGSLYRDSSAALSSLFHTCCVVDTWRHLHPGRTSFSWMRPDGSHTSRINLFGCPISWISGVSACDILACPYSDHSAILTTLIILSQTPRGPGRWRLNVSLLQDDVFVAAVESFWGSWRSHKDRFPSLQAWWDRGKERIKGIAVRFSTHKKELEVSSRTFLTALANHLKGQIDLGFASFLDPFEGVLARIAAIDRQEAEGARIRSRIQWAEEGEASTCFFLHLVKRHVIEEWCPPSVVRMAFLCRTSTASAAHGSLSSLLCLQLAPPMSMYRMGS